MSFAKGVKRGGEAFFALEEQGGGSAVWAHISGKPFLFGRGTVVL